MSTENTPGDVWDLPQAAEVFEALRRGRHLCARDGELFQALQNREALFEKLFAKLGFKLVRHPREFYYFHDSANFTDLSSRMAVFLFILVEHLADQGEPVEDTVMTRRFAYPDLPHLDGERYRTLLREAGVATPEDLAAVVRTLERFGFARRLDGATFCFDPPVYRFLSLCMEMAARASAEEDNAAPSETREPGEAET